MRPRTLLVVFVLVVAVGAFIWLYERELPSSDERAELAKKVLRFKKEDVNGLLLEWEGKRVRLERVEEAQEDETGQESREEPSTSSDQEWRIAEPLQARADRWAVDRLVQSLVDLEKERTLEGADRTALGLEKPRAQVTLITEEDDVVLQIGAEIPASSTMVVALATGADAFITSDSLYGELTQEPGDWRSREMFRGSRDQIERITLSAAGSKMLLGRRGEDFWLESPITDLADDDLVNRLLSDVVGLRAETFRDDPAETLSELGLEPPLGTIEVVLRDREQPIRIEVGMQRGEEQSRTYARVEGQAFETLTKLMEPCVRTAEQWRARSWSSFETYNIDGVDIDDAEGSVSLVRSDGDWRRGDDSIAYTTVSDLLYAVTDAKAERVLSPQQAAGWKALEMAPVITIRFRDDEENEETLSLYPETSQGTPARVSGREAVLVLKPDTVAEVRDKVAAVRAAEPLSVEEATDEAAATPEGES